MSVSRRAFSRSYARAVERRWTRLCQRAVILSERDWALIEDWQSRGIPLQIVEEAIDAAEQRRRRARAAAPPPRGLAYVAPAVEQAWRLVLEGRSRDPGSDRARPGPASAGAWRARLEAEPRESALRRLLESLLRALEAGDPPGEIDARLERTLPAAAPPALLREVETEVALELRPYQGRMEAATLATTRRRVVLHRLRARLGLPRLERSPAK